MGFETREIQTGDILASLLGGTMEVLDIVENPDLYGKGHSLSL